MTDSVQRMTSLSADQLRLLAARLKEKDRAEEPQVARRPRPEGPLPLSFGQERLWFLDRVEPGTAVYNLPTPLRLAGPLDAGALRRTLEEIVRRHEALRTTFTAEGGQPSQVIAPPTAFPLPRVDLEALPAPAREEELARLLAAEARRPFDLERGPLLRAALLRLSPEEHALALTAHHIVSDGWSAEVLMREMSLLYEALAAGRPSPLPALPAQYADWALWQREHLQGETLAGHLAFWRERLDGVPPLELPADGPRPPLQTFRGAEERTILPAALTERLETLARREGTTLFMALTAAFQGILCRLSAQTDFAVGSPVANRGRREVEGLIGFFANTLALRADLSGDPTFRELLGRVRAVTLEAFAHEDLPFEKLVAELQPTRDRSRPPLVQVLCSLQSRPALRLGRLGVELLDADTGTARVDLTLVWHRDEGALRGTLEHNTDLFGRASARRFLERQAALLEAAVADPERTLWDLPLLDAAERAQLLTERSGSPTPYPAEATVPELFAEQVRRAPAAPAVEFGDVHWTYAELAERAQQLAAHLRRLGVTPGDRVGLELERSAGLVAGMLGTLTAGAAYVPLDPSYPPERLAWMRDDASLAAVVTAAELEAAATARGGAPPVRLPSASPAYILYTSGSTGQPKGVVVPHRAIARLVLGTDYVRLDRSDRVAQIASPSFDAATFEIWGPLLTGGCVVGLGREVSLSPELFARELAERKVTALFLTTALFNQVARQAPGAFRGLRHLLFGGEAVDPNPVRAVRTEGPERLLHVYGPTESTTFATWHPVEEVPAEAASVPIGRALANTRTYVADPALRLAPEGIPGELLLGGDGLAAGYWRRPDLTAERFVPHPWSERPGERLYRTGDLVRWRAGGNLEFIGRIDQQVKIRGFRIEPGEIEAALLEHPAVTACAVVARQDAPGDRRLAAYLVLAGGAGPAELRTFLAARLPAHMVPAAFVPLPTLPLNPNGKVDRRALLRLPPPAAEALAGGGTEAAPRSPVELAIAEAWTGLLGLERIGIHDDFFALGGHSLLAIQALSRLRDLFGVEVPVPALFEEPTVAGIAAHVEAALRTDTADAAPPLGPAPRGGPLPLSYAQERLWFLEQLEPGSAFYNIPAAARLAGPLEPDVLRACLAEMARRHEALRTSFGDRGGQPFQEIGEPAAPAMPLVDLAGLPPSPREAEMRRLATDETRRPFDLTRGALFRAPLFRLGAADHVIVATMHHIVSDGWSMTVFLREMAALYDAFSAGRPSPLSAPRLQHADYAVWQRRWLQGEALETRLAYWRERLAGVPGLALPTDRPRPAVETFRGRQNPVALSPELTAGLHDLARRQGTTLFMVLLAAFQTLLRRWTGQTDLAVGSPIANRNRSETEGAIGFFANTLVLRTDLAGDPSFREILGRVREVTLGAYAHEDVPFEKVVESVQPERDMSRNPLFQVMLVLQNQPWPEMRMGEATLTYLPVDSGTAKFDLTLFWREERGVLAGTLEHNSDLFDETTARRFHAQYETLLHGAITDPERRIGELALLGEAGRHQLLREWNSAWEEPWAGRCVHRWVEAQVDRTPLANAVTDGERSLTYAQLEERANRLARGLRRHGVGPESLVGICVERSLEMVVAALAVAKAGGALVALDPAYPRERLATIIDDAGLAVLLTQASLLERFPQHTEIALLYERGADLFPEESTERLESGADPDNPVYAIYTSGSTGQPKGILVTHRAFSNLLAWQLGEQRGARGLRPGGRTVQLSTFGFCVSFQEMFSSWCSGGALVVADEMTRRDLGGLGAFLEEHGIERLHLPFAALKGLAEAAAGEDRLPSRLAEVITAGEQLQVTPAVRALFERLPGCALSNQYGASETHVVSALTLTGSPAGWPAIPPVGRPVARVRIHLLDGWLEPVPVGVAGELYAGGACLPRCYLNDPVLTAQKLVPDPYSPAPGGRLYRTGDSARYLADGRIEYHGRIDTQVKIRGFRVELGEIDTVLARHPAVRDAAVVAKPGGADGQRLVAYVVPAAPGAAPADELRSHLRQKLPEHMVPAAFVEMAALPVNANGKLDQAALPEPDLQAESRGYVAPRTPIEELVAGVWGEVLGIERVGVHDNFFAIGGHSLLATRVISRLRQALGIELRVRALFEAPTVTELTVAIAEELLGRAGAGLESLPLLRASRDEPLVLSFSQRRLWFLDQLGAGSPVYNLPAAVELTGQLDVPALAAAFGEVLRRHEVLRTTFQATVGEPVQVVAAPAPFTLPLVDLQGLPGRERRREESRLASTEARRPFDLSNSRGGPLLRATLLRTEASRHVVLVTMHHIASDGWSIGVLVRELGALYTAFVKRRPSPLPELAVQYADFAAWQHRRLSSGLLEAELAWWRRELAGMPPALDLPTDHPRPAVPSGRGAIHSFLIEPEDLGRLTAVSRRSGATLFMTLLAGFAGLLERSTGHDDLAVGTPVAGRTHLETEPLIGFFVNLLVLRMGLAGDPDFAELLDRVRETALSAYAHQEVPFERLVEDLAPERDTGRPPLAQVLLALQNAPSGPLELPGLALTTSGLDTGTARLDLTCTLTETEGGLAGTLEYSRDLFERPTIQRLAGHFTRLLAGAAADPRRRLSELPLLSEPERAQLLVQWRGETTTYPREASIHALFAEQAALRPDAVAVAGAGMSLTYGELRRRAGRWARRLRAMGVGPEVRVGLCLDRSPARVVATLAVLEAGGVYVPLDPHDPQERLARLLEDSAAVLCIHGEETWEEPAAASPELADVPAEALAYVMYTSGSTGEPKGVAVPHRAVVRLVREAGYARFGPDEVFLQLAPYSFDASTLELWGALLHGGRVVVPPPGVLSPAELGELFAEQGVTTLWLTAGLFHQMVEDNLPGLAGVGQLLAGGDVLSPAHVRRVVAELPGTRLINGYGPTENTTFTCCHPASEDREPPVPVGRPLANTWVYLLDRHLAPVPIGTAGQLYAGGDGLARGYLGRPERTAESFIPDPFSGLQREAGGRLYRTGDLARYLPDGQIEYLGRIDTQVKIRGYRIEPGEIEAALVRHAGVRRAAVVARPSRDGKILVAYVVPAVATARRDGSLFDELRTHLKQRLSEHMIPSAFVEMQYLPLNANGKLDRAALPEPEPEDDRNGYVAPRTPVEALIAGIWAEVLGLERVGVCSDFFALGGHSLLATRVVTRVRQALGVNLGVRALFDARTVAGLTLAVAEELLGRADAASAAQALAAAEAAVSCEVAGR